MASTLRIAVDGTFNAHFPQARLWIDGEDWLGPEVAGLDPPMLAAELSAGGSGKAVVGRRWLNSFECEDVTVKVTRTQTSVHWSECPPPRMRFDAAQYDAEVARFTQDKSWETLERAAGREVGEILRGTNIKGGFEFEWASAEPRQKRVRLCFRRGHRQKFLNFRWDGASLADAVNGARLFRAERLSHCDQVHASPHVRGGERSDG